jgi:uncharacterized cupin superfamily protein
VRSRILNLRNVRAQKLRRGRRYESAIQWVGMKIGSRKLGFNVTRVPPGRAAWPYHSHHANEEMFFVLEGRGSIRIANRKHRIREGDFISLPPGPGSAHQIVNDSKAPLRYLAVSTMEAPEIAEYPESGKLGIFTGTAPGRTPGKRGYRHYARLRDRVGYWDGEG